MNQEQSTRAINPPVARTAAGASVVRLVSKKEIAARYSVHRKTIEKWVDCGILPKVVINCRCVRFNLEKCDRAMDRRERGPR